MDEKKAKELTDSIFDKLNDQERLYLAWIHNQKNKQIQELKEENEFLKLSNPEMNLEHFRYVKENKRKIDNLRLVNKRLNNIINKIEEHFVFLKMNSTGGNKEFFEDILDFIKALRELKGSDKE